MDSRQIVVGDHAWTVRIGGPEKSRHTVLLLPDAHGGSLDAVCERLHNSDLRTVVVDPAPGLDEAAVYAILDEVKVPYTNLAGVGTGAVLAWQLCARGFGRFMTLVAAGAGHPAAPDADGTVADPACPAVEIPATVIATKALPLEAAQGSARFVRGEFRVTGLDVADIVAEADHEFATEIVLRSGLW
ncbi:alpha/beta hydrolase [Nocardia stercoris]|uniref:Alpha/beta hydrolase n=1 Tax=Nocardia stercoris TaxID=2483361 RepID=A0A3M2LDN3_9NOCA|nr:alpha/beta hydrolase [Nocardia stercoris]RMI35649.1 alpha/beta hydrolase [Nocardia stercoris]